jgi:transcriptional regulator with XRE-family HTH domain
MKQKILKAEMIPEFEESIAAMPEDSKIFVDKSLEIADYIFWIMGQKGMKQRDLADKMGKSEAEVSKLLAGMHNYTLRSLAKIELALGTSIICTPRSVRIIFPAETITKSVYVITEKKQDTHFSRIHYDAKVIPMPGKSQYNQNQEAI